MTIAKLTTIALAAAAVMFSGCSTDNRIAGPNTDSGSLNNKLNELTTVTPEPNSTGRVAVRTGNSDQGHEQFTITAKVDMIDVDNGCWYLVTTEGDTYTPVTPKDLVLRSGLTLKAEGYVDKNIQFFCGNGPAFVIENYEIIDRPKGPDDNDRDYSIKTGNSSLIPFAGIKSPFDDRASGPSDVVASDNSSINKDEVVKNKDTGKRGGEERPPKDEFNGRP